jgi:hypothetical protein
MASPCIERYGFTDANVHGDAGANYFVDGSVVRSVPSVGDDWSLPGNAKFCRLVLVKTFQREPDHYLCDIVDGPPGQLSPWGMCKTVEKRLMDLYNFCNKVQIVDESQIYHAKIKPLAKRQGYVIKGGNSFLVNKVVPVCIPGAARASYMIPQQYLRFVHPETGIAANYDSGEVGAPAAALVSSLNQQRVCIHKAFVQGSDPALISALLQTHVHSFATFREDDASDSSLCKVYWGMKDGNGFWPFHSWMQMEGTHGHITEIPYAFQNLARRIESLYEHDEGYLNLVVGAIYFDDRCYREDHITNKNYKGGHDASPVYSFNMGANRKLCKSNALCIDAGDLLRINPGSTNGAVLESGSVFPNATVAFHHISREWIKDKGDRSYDHNCVGKKLPPKRRVACPCGEVNTSDRKRAK